MCWIYNQDGYVGYGGCTVVVFCSRQVSHTLCSAMQRRKFQQKARSLWQAEYCQEPFVVELDPSLYYTDDDLPSRLSYDVMAAAARQRVFAYQVRTCMGFRVCCAIVSHCFHSCMKVTGI